MRNINKHAQRIQVLISIANQNCIISALFCNVMSLNQIYIERKASVTAKQHTFNLCFLLYLSVFTLFRFFMSHIQSVVSREKAVIFSRCNVSQLFLLLLNSSCCFAFFSLILWPLCHAYLCVRMIVCMCVGG